MPGVVPLCGDRQSRREELSPRLPQLVVTEVTIPEWLTAVDPLRSLPPLPR
jgi:hypothetical protein